MSNREPSDSTMSPEEREALEQKIKYAVVGLTRVAMLAGMVVSGNRGRIGTALALGALHLSTYIHANTEHRHSVAARRMDIHRQEVQNALTISENEMAFVRERNQEAQEFSVDLTRRIADGEFDPVAPPLYETDVYDDTTGKGI